MSANGASLGNWINETITMQLPKLRMPLSLEDSELLARLVREIAQSSSVPIIFNLVGAHGRQRLLFSMDNALLISYTLAPREAWTAAALKMPTHELATLVQPDGNLYGFEKEKDICYFGGGFPCQSGRRLLGGIGISGGSVEGDMLIARQAMMRFSVLRYPLTTTR